MLCARDEAAVKDVAARLAAQQGGRIEAMRCDVGDPKSVDALVAETLLNGSAASMCWSTMPASMARWAPSTKWTGTNGSQAININLMGTVYPCRAVIAAMKAQKSGKIINLSGGGATNPLPGISAYAASKAAVVRFTETLALELKAFGIDVNAVAPGALATRMMDQLLEAKPAAAGEAFMARMQKLKDSGGTPLSVGAKCCVWLASAASDGITGKLIAAQWDPYEDIPAACRRAGRRRHLYPCAASRPRTAARPGGMTDAAGDRRLRPDRPEARRRRQGPRASSLVADLDPARAQALADKTGAKAAADWQALVAADLDAVIVATTHDSLAPIAIAALEAGKHVLVEKPAGMTVDEVAGGGGRRQARPARSARSASTTASIRPSGRPRRSWIPARSGPMMFIRGRYGHGGRLGMEKEWRAIPELSGGGELIDQGSHLIDLSRWFLGDLRAGLCRHADPVLGHESGRQLLPGPEEQRPATSPGCMPAGRNGRTCSRLEIYGRDGKLVIDGLGGSYGAGEADLLQNAAADGPAGNHACGIFPAPMSAGTPSSPISPLPSPSGRRATGDIEDALAMHKIIAAAYRETDS